MKTDNPTHFWASELRVRTNNLKEVKDHEQFGIDAARLIDWLQQNQTLAPIISSLKLEEERAYAPTSRILQSMSDELTTLWGVFAKFKIDDTNIPPAVLTAKEEMAYKLKSPHVYPILDFYHLVRTFVEGLAGTAYDRLVAPYYVQSLPDRAPLLRGKIYELFISYSERDNEVKSLLKTTTWGSWANLRHIINLSRGDNPFWQLKQWFELFKHDETIINLNRLADYIFDYNEKPFKEKLLAFKDHPYAEFSIFEKGFNLVGNKLDLLEYGRISFDPTKSPNKQSDPNGLTIGQDVIRIILESGTNGIQTREISKQLRLEPNDIYSHTAAFNKRCRKLFGDKKIDAYVEIVPFGKQGNTHFQFLIIPRQIYSVTDPSQPAIESSKPTSFA